VQDTNGKPLIENEAQASDEIDSQNISVPEKAHELEDWQKGDKISRNESGAAVNGAEAVYEYEYRKKLIKESARQLEKERRLAEERLRFELSEENKRRAEAIYMSHQSERENIDKRSEASDELINSAMRRLEQNGEEAKESSFDEDFSERIPENVIVDPGEGALISVDNILYIPPHSLTIPIPTYIGVPRQNTSLKTPKNENGAPKNLEKSKNNEAAVPVNYEVNDSVSLRFAEKDTLKRIRKTDKEIDRLRKKEASSAPITQRLLYNRRLALEKEVFDYLSFLLFSAVKISENAKIRKYRQLLSARIARYNLVISEFISRTGMDVAYVSKLVPEDIIKGHDYQKPKNLFVFENADIEFGKSQMPTGKALRRAEKEAVRRTVSEAAEMRHIEKELSKNGLATDDFSESEKAAFDEGMYKISEQISTDEDMIFERYRYLTLKCDAEMGINMYSFSTRKTNKLSNVRHLKKLKRLIKMQKRHALKCERLDNDRYYEIVALDTSKLTCPRVRADRGELEALKEEMQLLLEKRDSINNRLYKLYLGRDEMGKSSFEKKVTKARIRALKATYKKQLKLYKTVEKERLPLEMKERVYNLMNERTRLNGYIEELRIRIRGAKGTEKGEIVRERRRVVKEIKCINSDINYYYKKKVKGRISKSKTKRSQLLWLILVLVIAASGYLLYRLFGERFIEFIKSYISGLFGGLI
jgi:hypothetical protein